jgi:hypothetical protein
VGKWQRKNGIGRKGNGKRASRRNGSRKKGKAEKRQVGKKRIGNNGTRKKAVGLKKAKFLALADKGITVRKFIL